MTTLDQAPLAPLLDRMFADAARTDTALRAEFIALTPEERQAASVDFRAFFTRAKDAYLPVSRETGRLLYMLARSTRAKAIVEFGTSFGISTLHLAAALRDTWGVGGGGIVIGSEFEPGKIARARANLAEAGLGDLADIRDGDAMETLARDLPETIDLVLLDGHKPLYFPLLKLLEPRLRKGALIVADNADMCPEYVAAVRGDNGYSSAPLGGDVELSMRQ
ncbi:O-methyltransferase [Sphingomonas bacterium]|uniref:O-methyltransferase n=1 Tax=Sphingomonas bacterium TaxID=1895847 RepID=UPI00157769D4|nr:class I SAM-dependent methyltransferase [Sphingomonas bacterium]